MGISGLASGPSTALKMTENLKSFCYKIPVAWSQSVFIVRCSQWTREGLFLSSF